MMIFDTISIPGFIATAAAILAFAAFMGEIDIRNREIWILKEERDELRTTVKELRDDNETLRAERDAAEERCEELEDEIESDERLVATRDELAEELEARRADAERLEEHVRHKDMILVVMATFGVVTLFLAAMVSLVVIVESGGH